MKRFKRVTACLVCGAIPLLLAACSQVKLAQQAINDIDNAIDAIPQDAKQYVPTELASIESKQAELKAFYAQQKYAAVLADAPGLVFEAKNVSAEEAVKKEVAMKTLAAEWTELAGSVPQLVASVKTQVEAQSKSKRKLATVDLSAAKNGLEDATILWRKGQDAYAAGNFTVAVSDAKEARIKAEAAASALKVG